MNTGEKTKRYAVIGHPVAHSLSPVMHNANFQANGDTDCVYEKEDVAPADLERFILENPNGYSGLSVTIPHKEKLYSLLSRNSFSCDQLATASESVNTVLISHHGPKGYSTDGEGWLKSYEEDFGGTIAGKSVCVLGSGGSAKAVALAARMAGAALVLVAARNASSAAKIAGLCRTIDGSGIVEAFSDWSERTKAVHSAEVVVNCTPVGMKPSDVSDWLPNHFRAGQHFMDLIYVKPETLMMQVAKAGGAEVENGLGMLLHQGAKQYEIWTGKNANTLVMRAALEQALYGRTQK